MDRCVQTTRNDLAEIGRTLFHGSIPVFVFSNKKNQKAFRYPIDQPKFESGTLSTTLECH